MSPFALSGPVSFDRVFVGGVPRGTTEPQLRAAFARAGTEVGVIEFVLDPVTGLQRGFAFVRLCARVESIAEPFALGRLRSTMLDGQVLDVQGVREHRPGRFTTRKAHGPTLGRDA